MKFYTLALPNETIFNVNELTLNEVKTNIKFNIKGELNFPITNLYYIKNYIIFLDEKENFYYMIYDNFPIYKSDDIDCVYPLAITRTYEKIISISAWELSVILKTISFIFQRDALTISRQY